MAEAQDSTTADEDRAVRAVQQAHRAIWVGLLTALMVSLTTALLIMVAAGTLARKNADSTPRDFFADGCAVIVAAVGVDGVSPLGIASLVAVIAVAVAVARADREKRLLELTHTPPRDPAGKEHPVGKGRPVGKEHPVGAHADPAPDSTTDARIVQLEINVLVLVFFTTVMAEGTTAIAVALLWQTPQKVVGIALLVLAVFLVVDSTPSIDSFRTGNHLSRLRDRLLARAALRRLGLSDIRAEDSRAVPNPDLPSPVSGPRLWITPVVWGLVIVVIAAAFVTDVLSTGDAAVAIREAMITVVLILVIVVVSNGMTELSSLRARLAKVFATTTSAIFTVVVLGSRWVITMALTSPSHTVQWVSASCTVALVVLLVLRTIGRTGHGGAAAFARLDVRSAMRPGRSANPRFPLLVLSAAPVLAAPVAAACLVGWARTLLSAGDGQQTGPATALDPWLWCAIGAVLCLMAFLTHTVEYTMGVLAVAPATALIVLVVGATWADWAGPPGATAWGWLLVFAALVLLLCTAAIAAVPAAAVSNARLRSVCAFVQFPADEVIRRDAARRHRNLDAVLHYPQDPAVAPTRTESQGDRRRRRPRH